MPAATERTTKKDIIKIGTTDVVIQKESEGPMIFGESVPKEKITTPKSKGEPGEGGGKDIQ